MAESSAGAVHLFAGVEGDWPRRPAVVRCEDGTRVPWHTDAKTMCGLTWGVCPVEDGIVYWPADDTRLQRVTCAGCKAALAAMVLEKC